MSSGRQLALLWGGVVGALLLAAPLAASIAPALPACPLKKTTGLPCPACGSGRAVVALTEGRLAEALHWNPGAAVAAVLFVVGGLVFGVAAARGVEPPGLPKRLPGWLRWGAVALLIANWWWVWQVAGV